MISRDRDLMASSYHEVNLVTLRFTFGTVALTLSIVHQPYGNHSMSRRFLIVIFGTAIMTATYYVWHKPLTAPALLVLGGALLDLLAAALLFTAAGGVGRRLLVFAPTEALSRAERVGLEGMIGFGVLAWLGLAVAWAGSFTQSTLWAVLVVAILGTAVCTRSYLRDLRTLARAIRVGEGAWARLLAGLVLFWLGTALLLALMPPTAWDSLMYHMLIPQRVLAAGQLTPYPDNHYLGFPQTAEILFAWANGLTGRDSAAALVHYGAGLLGLVSVAGTVHRHTDDTAAPWFAAALLLGGSSFWLGFTREYVDMAVFALSAAALAALLAWRDKPERAWIVVLGLLAGVAVGVKYTAGLLAVALGVAVAAAQPRRVLQNGVLLAGMALLAYLPWGLRGLVQYGNPFYPFFFGGLAWDATRSAGFSAAGDGLLAQGVGGVFRLLLLPFVATAAGTEGGLRYSFDAGLWLMPLAVLAWLGWDRLTVTERTLTRTATLLLAPMLLMWAGAAALSGIGAQTRLVIPVFPAFAALGALGFAALARWGKRPINLHMILQAVVAFTLVFGALGTLRAMVSANPLALVLAVDGDPRAAYLERTLGVHYTALQQLDDVLPLGSRVLFAFEPRAYYCPPGIACDPDALTDHWLHLLVAGGQTPDEIMAQWQQDADAVLLFRFAYDTFFLVDESIGNKAENALFLPALDAHARLLWQDEAGVYQVWVWDEE